MFKSSKRSSIIRSRARWYEHDTILSGTKFLQLEKQIKGKHITSLKINDHVKLTDPKDILEEKRSAFLNQKTRIRMARSLSNSLTRKMYYQEETAKNLRSRLCLSMNADERL